jgi:hypothetical protein
MGKESLFIPILSDKSFTPLLNSWNQFTKLSMRGNGHLSINLGITGDRSALAGDGYFYLLGQKVIQIAHRLTHFSYGLFFHEDSQTLWTALFQLGFILAYILPNRGLEKRKIVFRNHWYPESLTVTLLSRSKSPPG